MSDNAIIKSMDDAERAAKAMSASGFFQDARQAAQAVVKILAGQELGFGPFASMTGVHIIQNKPTLAANLMAAAVKRTGKYNYRVVEHTDTVCDIAFFENDKEVGHSRFSMEDARKAGVTGNPTWQKYPRNMLFARALSNGQKWFAPDVFNGTTVYTPEELGANVDADGNVIDIQSQEVMPLEQNAEVTEMQIATTTPKQKQSKAVTEKPGGVIGWLLDVQQVDNVSHAAQIANILKLTDPKLSKDEWERRYSNYRSLRDAGKSAQEAAQELGL